MANFVKLGTITTMSYDVSEKCDRVNVLVASALFLLVFIVYYLTKAPTVSFWDCGEFIACASVLGIPHPPGTPLYVLLGRLFTLLPLGDNPAVRINMLSVISSSFTALFGYLILVRILRQWFQPSALTRYLTYAGSFSGALLLAWGLTNWNNSLEAEVYGTSMMLMLAIVWLALIFLNGKSGLTRVAAMLLITYLAFLGIGIHMTTFLVMPVIFALFVVKKENITRSLYLIALFLAAELYLVFALSSQAGEVSYYIPTAIIVLFYLLYLFAQTKIERAAIQMSALLIIALSPIFAAALNGYFLQRGGETVLSEGTLNIITVFGFAALIGGALLGLFKLKTYRQLAQKTENRLQLFITACAPIVALVMVALLYIPAIGGSAYFLFLIISLLLLAVIAFFLRESLRWSYLIAVVALLTVVISMKIFAASLLIGALLLLVLGGMKKITDWKPALAMILVGVIGFSVHLYLPIRASQQPRINESDPSASLTATINFLERKQYERTSMIERMFVRRAEWKNQFGVYGRLGFWGFFREQYGIGNSGFALLLIIGIFGLWELIRRKPEVGIILILLILISSVGLVLYMNFADGTRQLASGRDHIEVRDRDYFFTPAFIIFSMAIGLGLTALVNTVRENTATFSKSLRIVILASISVMFLMPGYTLAGNYYFADRSKNHIAFNYGWNLLQSAGPNAVLFTQGDNDTFPLWCLQEAFGIRTDVKLVNLSLANALWYVKQLQSIQGINLGWTNEQIDQIRPIRTRDGRTFRIQDLVIDAIINNNYGRIPIEFSVTVPSSARKYQGRSIDNRLVMNGMSWLVGEDREKISLDVNRCYRYFTGPGGFKANGYDDPTIYKNETTMRLASNYINSILMTAEQLERENEPAKAKELIVMATRILPKHPRILESFAGMLAHEGNIEELRDLVDTTDGGDRRWINSMLGRAELVYGDASKGEQILNAVLVGNPDYRTALEDLLRYYSHTNELTKMKTLLQRWIQFNPDDTQMKGMLQDVLKKESAPGGNR